MFDKGDLSNIYGRPEQSGSAARAAEADVMIAVRMTTLGLEDSLLTPLRLKYRRRADPSFLYTVTTGGVELNDPAGASSA